jgi:hypothetical protein
MGELTSEDGYALRFITQAMNMLHSNASISVRHVTKVVAYDSLKKSSVYITLRHETFTTWKFPCSSLPHDTTLTIPLQFLLDPASPALDLQQFYSEYKTAPVPP